MEKKIDLLFPYPLFPSFNQLTELPHLISSFLQLSLHIHHPQLILHSQPPFAPFSHFTQPPLSLQSRTPFTHHTQLQLSSSHPTPFHPPNLTTTFFLSPTPFSLAPLCFSIPLSCPSSSPFPFDPFFPVFQTGYSHFLFPRQNP